MKKTSILSTLTLLAVLSMAFTVSSCVREEVDSASREVVFSAATSYENGTETRTVYSDEFFNVSGNSGVERIDWVPGDQIRVLNATSGMVADYTVGSPEGEDEKSVAGVTANGTPLLWEGTGSNTFVAVYPAGGMSASTGAVSCTIPATQALTRDGSTTRFKPDMQTAYMVAKATSSHAAGPVTLPFNPAMTAFEFAVRIGEGESVTVTGVDLVSTVTPITGTFTWDPATETFTCPITLEEGVNDRVSATFGTAGFLLEADQILKFTLFALPQDLSGLKITFHLSSGDKTLSLKKDGAWTTFTATKKYRITTPGVDGDWDYVIEHTGTTITLSDGTTVAGLVEIGADLTGSSTFNTYKTHAGTTTRVAVPVEVVAYATADADGNCNNDWSTTVPAGITGITPNVPAVAATLGAEVSTQPDETLKETISSLIEHARSLKARTPANDLDLSLHDIHDLTAPRSSGHPITANCYVINRSGSFRFPLVYGNAVDWTKNTVIDGCDPQVTGCNLYAYRNLDGTVDRHRFDGNPVSSPYILTDLGLTVNDVEAVVVWEDVESSTYRFIDENPTVLSVSTDKFYLPDGTRLSEMPYISFNVPLGAISEDETIDDERRITGIREGNALIALRTKNSLTLEGNTWEAGTILWSWHIWVSDQDMTPINLYVPEGPLAARIRDHVEIIPSSIGFCDDRVRHFYADHVWYVRIAQTEGNEDPLVFKVIQRGTVDFAVNGNNSLYVYGRKDPFIATANLHTSDNKNYNKRNYSPAGYTVETGETVVVNGEARYTSLPTSSASGSGYDGALETRNPYKLFFSDFQSSGLYWSRLVYKDLSGQWLEGNKVIPAVKTLFDPCPPGFGVAGFDSFKNFTKGEWHAWSFDKINAQDRDGDGLLTRNDSIRESGWYLYYDEAKTQTIFLPFNHNRQSTNGKAMYTIPGYKFNNPAQRLYYTPSMIDYGASMYTGPGFLFSILAERDVNPSDYPDL